MSDSPETTIETPVVETPVETPPEATPEIKVTPKVDYFKAELDRQKQLAAEERQARLESEARIEEMNLNSMKEKENTQGLMEHYKTKYETELERNNKLESSHEFVVKDSAIKAKLPEFGVRDDCKDIVEDLVRDSVQIEYTSTGRENVLGINERLEELKLSRPSLFVNSTPPVINGAAPTPAKEFKQLNGAELLALSKTDPAKYKEYVAKKLKGA